MIRRLAGAALDRSIVFSFDRTGFARHSAGFEPADLDVDLTGRSCLITGANSGIGLATARALAARGARTWLLCRSPERGAAARDAIRAETGNDDVHLARVDLSDFASIRRFAADFPDEPIHVLAHNAGVLPDERSVTAEGLELTLATNLVGPFLLTWLLRDRLAAGQARLLHVSSGGMYGQSLDTGALNSLSGPFDGVIAYARSKRGQVVLNELLAERLVSRGVTAYAMHPGWAETPAVISSLPRFYRATRAILRTPEQGADTLIWLAARRERPGPSGTFWFDRRPQLTHLVPWTREDPQERSWFWAQMCEWIGIEPGAF